MRDPTEKPLVDALRRGEPAGFDEVYARYRGRILGFLLRLSRRRDVAEDLFQETFCKLARHAPKLAEDTDLAAWLFRVARNRMIDLFRRKKPSSLNNPISAEEDADTLEDLLPSADAGPEAAYARNLLLDALEEALDELPEAQRQVFIAHEVLGQSFKEISAETGLSVNTLLSRKHYAVLYLRQRLQSIHENFAKK